MAPPLRGSTFSVPLPTCDRCLRRQRAGSGPSYAPGFGGTTGSPSP